MKGMVLHLRHRMIEVNNPHGDVVIVLYIQDNHVGVS